MTTAEQTFEGMEWNWENHLKGCHKIGCNSETNF